MSSGETTETTETTSENLDQVTPEAAPDGATAEVAETGNTPDLDNLGRNIETDTVPVDDVQTVEVVFSAPCVGQVLGWVLDTDLPVVHYTTNGDGSLDYVNPVDVLVDELLPGFWSDPMRDPPGRRAAEISTFFDPLLPVLSWVLKIDLDMTFPNLHEHLAKIYLVEAGCDATAADRMPAVALHWFIVKHLCGEVYKLYTEGNLPPAQMNFIEAGMSSPEVSPLSPVPVLEIIKYLYGRHVPDSEYGLVEDIVGFGIVEAVDEVLLSAAHHMALAVLADKEKTASAKPQPLLNKRADALAASTVSYSVGKAPANGPGDRLVRGSTTDLSPDVMRRRADFPTNDAGIDQKTREATEAMKAFVTDTIEGRVNGIQKAIQNSFYVEIALLREERRGADLALLKEIGSIAKQLTTLIIGLHDLQMSTLLELREEMKAKQASPPATSFSPEMLTTIVNMFTAPTPGQKGGVSDGEALFSMIGRPSHVSQVEDVDLLTDEPQPVVDASRTPPAQRAAAIVQDVTQPPQALASTQERLPSGRYPKSDTWVHGYYINPAKGIVYADLEALQQHTCGNKIRVGSQRLAEVCKNHLGILLRDLPVSLILRQIGSKLSDPVNIPKSFKPNNPDGYEWFESLFPPAGLR